MKFSRVIGKIDKDLVAKAEEQLSKVFLELALKYDNEHIGSGFGGDPLIFGLMYPVDHICTLNMPTAATDGKRYYWNPKFILKLGREGLRIVCAHEAWHAIYMHPQRRGSRLPKLWNIAVDYIVNGTVMEDFKTRRKDPAALFTKHLGKFMPLDKYAELLKDPFKKVAGFEEIDIEKQTAKSDVKLPAFDDDRELTEEEMQELEKREKREGFYFADPNLADDMKSPEKIYDYLYQILPKCPDCGSIGIYKKPKSGKKDKSKDKGDKSKDKSKSKDKGDDQEDGQGDKGDKPEKHDHGDGNPCDCKDHGDQPGDGQGDGDQDGEGQGQGQGQGDPCDHGCGSCGDGLDVFGLGGTVDDHMDTTESEEKLSKRIYEAMEAAKKMAGHVPAGLEDELGKLTAPKVSWKDAIRTRLLKIRDGNGRNDWTRFRTRPMFAGLMVPKKRSYFATFGCLLDTSGSMSREDMAYGISQLASLDEKAEGMITPGDCEIYWEDSTKIVKANAEELSKVKVVGRGGTMFCQYFTDYEKYIGKCDFLICITDGYLGDADTAVDPGIPVYWVVTSGAAFNPPFGRVFDLRNG